MSILWAVNPVRYTWGMTSDIKKRVYEHKNHSTPGFTDKYNIDKLLYVETTGGPSSAINREKQIKAWKREKRWHLSTRLIPNGMILVKIGTTNGVSSW